ncbi:MAG: hypothetical protein R2706_17815 [Acidimicrobiales bacterium]
MFQQYLGAVVVTETIDVGRNFEQRRRLDTGDVERRLGRHSGTDLADGDTAFGEQTSKDGGGIQWRIVCGIATTRNTGVDLGPSHITLVDTQGREWARLLLVDEALIPRAKPNRIEERLVADDSAGHLGEAGGHHTVGEGFQQGEGPPLFIDELGRASWR